MSATKPRPHRAPLAGAQVMKPSRPQRLAAAWRSVTGAGPAVTASFGLLVLGCAFLATAGPRQGLAMRTAALHRELAAAPAVQRSVELTSVPWEFAYALPGTYSLDGLGPPSATAADLAAVGGEAARALAATPLPLAARGADWAGLDTGRAPVGGAAAGAFLAGARPELEICYQDPLMRYARLADGRWPRRARVRFSAVPGPNGLGHAVSRATFEIAVTQATAARFGLHPGSRLTEDGVTGPLTLDVTGVLRTAAPASAFWTANPAAAAPVVVPRTLVSPAYWSGVAFTGPAELPALQAALPSGEVQFSWDFPLDLGGLDADQAPALAGYLSRVAARTLPLAGRYSHAASTLSVAAPGPLPVLSGFLATEGAVQTVLALLFTGLTVVGLAAVLLATQLMAARRAAEYALVRARGAALGQAAALALRDGAVIAVPAAAAGVILALVLTSSGNAVLAWWLGGITLLAALLGLPLAVAVQQRAGRPDAAAYRELDQAATRRTPLRRWVTEAALVAAAAGGLVVLHDQGLPSGPGLNVYPAAAPVLVAVPAALLVMRLYPLLLRGLLRLGARRAPVTWFIALTRAAWSGAFSVLPMFALVLALVLTSFAGMVRSAVTRGESAASWQAVGADAVLAAGQDNRGFTPATVRAVAGVRGVTHATALRVMTWAPGYGPPVQIAAVQPPGYAAFTAATPWPRFPWHRLGGPRVAATGGTAAAGADAGTGGAGRGTAAAAPGQPSAPVPAIAGPGARGALGAGPVVITTDSGPLTVQIAGTVPRTPAFPGSGSFLVLPLSALRGPSGPLLPNEMLLGGPDLDLAQLTATVHRLLPGASLTLRRTVLQTLADAPLQHGSYLLYAAGIAAAGGLSVLVLLLALAMTAPGRELTLTRLATMGLAGWQARLAAVAEALPAVLAAAAAGAACTGLLALLVGPALDLSVFTGSAAQVPVRADLGTVAVPAAGLAILGLITLAAEVTLARRRGLARALRLGG